MQIVKSISRFYNKNNIWGNLLLLFLVIILIKCIVNRSKPLIETFDLNKKYTIKEGLDVFDNFYTNLYDDITFNNSKNNFEIKEIMELTDLNSSSKVLDIGSGTGHHVALLSEKNIPVIGNFKPHGDYLMKDLYLIGGLKVVHKTLFDMGLLHKDCLTITGKTIYENVKKTGNKI